ncbi:MAG: DUF4173 domain-containing protein [Caulobacteraceae bacterium]|nr:DUF4173 domain-containing protein [Caulobacteraceae bacterium]
MPAFPRRRLKGSFARKPVLAVGLAILADLLFWGRPAGASLGLFALALCAASWVGRPAPPGDRRARWALAAAAVLALTQIEQPSLAGMALFGAAAGIAALSGRVGPREDVWRWLQRLAALVVCAPAGPVLDGLRLARRRPRRPSQGGAWRLAQTLLWPLAGGAVFLGLFALANPVIAQAMAQLRLPRPEVGRIMFLLLTAVAAWALLRPRRLRRTLAPPEGPAGLPGVAAGSAALSLVVFNLLFAVQNGLDIAFLWSGAPLPAGVILADYAHRGAYPLVATALLAGLFVLTALRPGSDDAGRPLIRGLVSLWVAQNVFLTASAALRTLDYVGAYSLTRLRLAALIWMGLVAVGLVLICWRLLRGKSAGWLIDANALAAAAVLAAVGLVDLGAVSAAWNVRHAREAGGAGAALDICYLRVLGASALVPLAELEQRPLDPELRDRVAWARTAAARDLEARQADWRGWTWRGARRLAAAARLSPGRGVLATPAPGPRDCDGFLQRPPAPPPAEADRAVAPLTAAPQG